jgi:drug/metabolite transporter (DMT)-like permease
MWARVLRGGVAGAAGTTALNAVTYLDMTLRGRGTSSTPERSVEKLADVAGVDVPGDEEGTRLNRVSGLGALLGVVTGVTVGAGYAVVDELTDGALERLPIAAGGLLVATVALLGANGPMVALGITDPRDWSPADWVSDLVPHLAYGLVLAFTYRATSR